MAKDEKPKKKKLLRSYGSRFDRIIANTRRFFQNFVRKTKYDLWEDMHDNEVANASNPVLAARNWFNDFASNPDNRITRKMMKSAQLYMFNYDNPIYKDVLDFFDTQPLLLSLGTYIPKHGIPREYGINIHLLPPRVRKLFLYRVFNIYKIEYMKNFERDKQVSFELNYKTILNSCKDLGIDFAVRMYAADRRKDTVLIPMNDWNKAVWVPSKGYSKISAVELEKEWQKFLNKSKKKYLGGESHVK